jgi:hypothetical protein
MGRIVPKPEGEHVELPRVWVDRRAFYSWLEGRKGHPDRTPFYIGMSLLPERNEAESYSLIFQAEHEDILSRECLMVDASVTALWNDRVAEEVGAARTEVYAEILRLDAGGLSVGEMRNYLTKAMKAGMSVRAKVENPIKKELIELHNHIIDQGFHDCEGIPGGCPVLKVLEEDDKQYLQKTENTPITPANK